MDTRDEIVNYLAQFLPVDQLSDDDDIFRRGFVSSMFAVQLVTFVEKHFDLTVAHEDLELSNFRSIASLKKFVDRKLSVKAVT